MSLILVFFVLCFVSLNVALPNNCNKGPDYWCQNEEQAVKCGVEAFCKLKFGNFKDKKTVPVENAPAVRVELYYESLCPGCRAFIMGQLYPTFQKLGDLGIIDIGLYPYGNAYERQSGDQWVFTCQHGEEECQLNLVESCALHLLGHQSDFMPFIHCLESNPSMASAQSCAEQLKIEWNPIYNCAVGAQGNQLEHEMAVKTRALNPPHQYVPWIVVDGQHTAQIQDAAQTNLLRYVCQKYTGVQPHACRSAGTDNHGRCMKN